MSTSARRTLRVRLPKPCVAGSNPAETPTSASAGCRKFGSSWLEGAQVPLSRNELPTQQTSCENISLMRGPRHIGAPPEGSIFGLPLPGGEYVLGLIIRRGARTARVGFVFEPVGELPSSPVAISRDDLGLLVEVETSAFDSKEWPVVSVIDDFDPSQWPDPPRLSDDKTHTPSHLQRWMVGYVRHRRRRALEDQTWRAEHPHLNDPAVGARYLRVPSERIVPFVQDQLSSGGILGRIVLDGAAFEQGTVISTLPEEVGIDAAVENPRSGAKLARRGRKLIRGHHVYPDGRRVPVHDDKLSVLTMVSEWVGSGPAKLAIFRYPILDAASPDELSRVSDQYEALGGWLTSHEGEQYIVAPPGASRDEELLRRVITNLPPWMQIGFLSQHERMFTRNSDLTVDDLTEVAERLEAIIIGAYDGEGYVVWTRTQGERWIAG